MCKHVAAVMYGIGVRLDTEPELLFKLRGVKHEELISFETSVNELTDGNRSRRRRTLDSTALETMFDIELEKETAATAPKPDTPARRTNPAPFRPTGAAVRKLHKKTSLSTEEFALTLGVSTASVIKWEKTKGQLNLKAKSLERLQKLHES